MNAGFRHPDGCAGGVYQNGDPFELYCKGGKEGNTCGGPDASFGVMANASPTINTALYRQQLQTPARPPILTKTTSVLPTLATPLLSEPHGRLRLSSPTVIHPKNTVKGVLKDSTLGGATAAHGITISASQATLINWTVTLMACLHL